MINKQNIEWDQKHGVLVKESDYIKLVQDLQTIYDMVIAIVPEPILKSKLQLIEHQKLNELSTLKEANRKMAELLKSLAEHESCSCSKNKSEM